MAYTLEPMDSPSPIPERRRHARQQVSSLTYAELGEGNGGIVLNISESGLAIQAAKILVGDGPLRVSFELPQSGNRLEASGHVIWTSESKKRGGIEFVDLPEEARKQVLDWISLESLPVEFQADDYGRASEAKQVEPQAAIPESPGALREPVAALAAPEEQTETLLFPAETAAVSEGTEEPVAILLPTALTPELADDLELTPTRQVKPNLAGHLAQLRVRWDVAVLAGLLVVISLVAGIAVFRVRGSGLAELLGAIKKVAPGKNAPAPAGTPVSTAAAPSAFPIEVVDVNDQHWMLTSGGASSAPVENLRRQAPVSAPAPPPRNKIPAQGWAFARPVLPQSKVVVSGSEEKGPPLLLLGPPASAESALRSVIPTDSEGLLPAPPAPAKASEQGDSLRMAKLSYRVEPVYPLAARQLRIEGIVKLHATIGRDGMVRALEPVEGQPLLAQAAMTAVRQWRYEPAFLHGQPVEVEANIVIDFHLPR